MVSEVRTPSAERLKDGWPRRINSAEWMVVSINTAMLSWIHTSEQFNWE